MYIWKSRGDSAARDLKGWLIMNDIFIETSEYQIINSSYIISIQKEPKQTTHYKVIEGEFEYYIIVRNLGIVKLTREKYIEIKNFLLFNKK